MKEMECVELLSFEEMVELYGSYYDENDKQYTIIYGKGFYLHYNLLYM